MPVGNGLLRNSRMIAQNVMGTQQDAPDWHCNNLPKTARHRMSPSPRPTCRCVYSWWSGSNSSSSGGNGAEAQNSRPPSGLPAGRGRSQGP